MNYTEDDKPVNLTGSLQNTESAALYITDETRDLEKSTVQLEELVIPKRSVSTLVIEK